MMGVMVIVFCGAIMSQVEIAKVGGSSMGFGYEVVKCGLNG